MTEPPSVWSVDGDGGSFGPPDDETSDVFTIEAGRLMFGDGYVCTRVSPAT